MGYNPPQKEKIFRQYANYYRSKYFSFLRGTRPKRFVPRALLYGLRPTGFALRTSLCGLCSSRSLDIDLIKFNALYKLLQSTFYSTLLSSLLLSLLPLRLLLFLLPLLRRLPL